MQDTSKFGILHLLGMQIVTAEIGNWASEHPNR